MNFDFSTDEGSADPKRLDLFLSKRLMKPFSKIVAFLYTSYRKTSLCYYLIRVALVFNNLVVKKLFSLSVGISSVSTRQLQEPPVTSSHTLNFFLYTFFNY